MAERITCLSIETLFDGNHNHPDIPRFIEEFSNALYTGDGKMPQMLDKLNIGPSFPVRLLVGIPQKELTRAQRLVAETYCSTIFGRIIGDIKGLWTYRAGWSPTNKNRKPALLLESTLDVDYMLSLGITKSIWCNDILFAPTAFNPQSKPKSSTLVRYMLALAAFGFPDPYQFFTYCADQE
jgi:hypothetical protein